MGVLKVWEDGAWVEAVPTDFLPLSGGTLSGPIDMNGNDLDRQGNIDFNGGKRIQFASETAAKINLYAANFGIGVDAGTLAFFTPGGNTFRFRKDSYNGVDVAAIDANGIYANGVWVPTLKVISNVALVVGHYYEVATVNYHRTVRFRIGVNGGGKPTRSQSLDGMAALPANDAEGASIYSGIMTIYGHTKGTMANSKLFDQLAVGPEKMWIRCSQASTVQVGIEAYDTASGANKTLSFADAGTAVGSYDEVAL